MIRAIMTGEPYGLRAEGNIKDGPLFLERAHRRAAGQRRRAAFESANTWRFGYEAQSKPAVMIWDAWDWVDRWNAQFIGWWEAADYVRVSAGDKMVLASLHLQPGKRVC